MNRIIPIISFVAGATIGTLVTWQCVKKKYELIAQEEINSVKEVYARSYAKGDSSIGNAIISGLKEGIEKVNTKVIENVKNIAKDVKGELSVTEYVALIKKNKYNTESNIKEEFVEEDEPRISDIPYIISPEEFNELYGYTTISLNYFSDGVVADDDDEIVDNVDEIIGEESLTHFGEYEDDSVYVRNDRLKIDYEVLKDMRNYSDVLNKKPYLKPHQMMEDE